MGFEHIDHTLRQSMMSSPPHGTKTFPVGAWRLDPDASSIAVSVRAFMVSPITLTVDLQDGFVSVDDSGVVRQIRVTLKADSVRSGNLRRDRHARGAGFLNSADSPLITFSGRSQLDVIHGVVQVQDHSTPLPLKATQASLTEDGRAVFAAHGVVDRRLLGLGRLSALLIGRELDVSVRGIAHPVR